jgi:hypothetical protein
MVTFSQEHCMQGKYTFLCKIKLLNDECIQWLYIQRIQEKLHEIPESSNVVVEWRNVKNMISQVADESLGKYKAFTQKKKL